MNDVEDRVHRRPRSLQAQRGFDVMRRIRDNVIECVKRGPHFVPDLIALSPQTLDDIQRCWLEMAPENAPMPMDIAGVRYQVGETQGYAYAFLRDYLPHEKREALASGTVLYGDDHKALIATKDA